jgi:hypothetical protein
MSNKVQTIEEEAAILKQIDEQLKGLSPDVRGEAFQILVERHLHTGPQSKAARKPQVKDQLSKDRPKRVAESLSVVKDLDLRAQGNIPSLRDFFKTKLPSGFAEQNALFAYYLVKSKEMSPVGANHIYTCYKEVGQRVPGAFQQSLKDTARRQGWLDTADLLDIKVTTIGENFVEHDLPRKNEK